MAKRRKSKAECKEGTQGDLFNKGKCTVYKKTHDTLKAAKGHQANIKKRGGKVTRTKNGKKYVLEYSFKPKSKK